MERRKSFDQWKTATVEQVKSWLCYNSNVVDEDGDLIIYNFRGTTPLLFYIEHSNNMDVIKFLANERFHLEEPDGSGNTALMNAVQNDETLKIKILIDAGANINTKNPREETLLMHASENNNIEIMQILINKGMNVNEKNERNKTAFDYATDAGSKEAMNLLIDNNAEIYEEEICDHNIEKADQQLTGFLHCLSGYSLVDLLDGMALKKEEWTILKKRYYSGDDQKLVEAVNEYFENKN